MTKHVPNLLTLGCLVLGFSELGAVLGGRADMAPAFLLLALLADGLAGQVARRRSRSTELGAELDSLAALIAFGISVMVLAFDRGLRQLGNLGWCIAVALAVAAALRLSRDNATKPDWPYYQGLPVGASGTAIGLLAGMEVAPGLLAGLSLALAALMLAPLRYARLSQVKGLQIAFGVLLGLAAFVPALRIAVLAIVLLYAVLGSFHGMFGLLEKKATSTKKRRPS